MSNQKLLKQALEGLEYLSRQANDYTKHFLMEDIKKELEKPVTEEENAELRKVAVALIEYIDAIPDYLADQFPAMPGVDRDWVNDVIEVSSKRIDDDGNSLTEENAKLKKGIEAVRALMDESYGVIGLIVHGYKTPWDDLEEGGCYENWLVDFNKAEELINHE